MKTGRPKAELRLSESEQAQLSSIARLPSSVPTGYDDKVGWEAPDVKFFRKAGRTPCGLTIEQVVSLQCPAPIGETAFATNTMYLGIEPLTALLTASRRGVVLLMVGATAFAADLDQAVIHTNGAQLTLTAEGRRAVAEAVMELNKNGYFITYEDPRYEYEGDLEDVAAEFRKDMDRFGPGEAPRLLVPKRTHLTVDQSTLDAADVVDHLVNAQARADSGGHFAFERTGSVYHVVPVEVRDADGNWKEQTSILDAPIDLVAEERSDADTLVAICKAIGAANGVKIYANVTGLRVGGSFRTMYRIGAESEPARTVLLRAINEIGVNREPMSWVLYYGYSDSTYALGLIRRHASGRKADAD